MFWDAVITLSPEGLREGCLMELCHLRGAMVQDRKHRPLPNQDMVEREPGERVP